MKNKKGFTLIALLIVASIIGLSALIGLRYYTGIAMNTSGWFPEVADTPGEIQITLLAGTFYVQGYGADGLLPNILTVKK